MARIERLPLGTLAAVAVVLLAASCGGSGKATGAAASSASGCPQVAAPAPRNPGKQPKPAARLAPGPWAARVVTSCGTFRFRLDTRDSPRTTAAFAKLANSGFFDDTIFHRIVPGFVIQGGDPTQTGLGGPGYTVVEPPPRGTRYRAGMVAMAKSTNEPRGAAGSQFFVLTGAAPWLGPDYALLGRVTSGMAVVRRIGRFGSADTGTPTRAIVVERIRVARA